MSGTHAEQLTLDGLAPRRRRKRAPAEKTPAAEHPIARVVIDVQAAHLGRTFDYLVEEKQSEAAQPGVRVRVRFGGKLLDGFIWQRADGSDTPTSSLRFLERVVSPRIILSEQMREDITRIAEAFGGTRANILRVAVPPRSAKVDREYKPGARATASRGEELATMLDEPVVKGFSRISSTYANADRLREALGGRGYGHVVWDDLPGPRLWAKDLAWAAALTLMRGRSVVIVLPDMRHVADMLRCLTAYGLRRFEPAANGVWGGDVAILGSSMAPELRYRSYMAVATGAVRCVIGLRAAMYAPVEGAAMFAIVDDVAYQNADGLMPYAQARDVLQLRARAHGGTFIAAGHARSPISQWESDHDPSVVDVHAMPSAGKECTPWIRWLNRDELNRLEDPAIGARVPHVAVSVMQRALRSGPVLLSVPHRGAGTVLACAHCHRQARCRRCSGPLQRMPSAAPQCRWCGAAAVHWQCPACSCPRMRGVRISAEDTMRELQGLVRGVPIMISTPGQPRGIIEDVAGKPQLVIATPGAEPRVMPFGERAIRGYQAVVILDAWTSLYAAGLDARIDTLTAWMRAAALCVPRTQGGQVLLVGETDSALAQSLITWNPRTLASRELDERGQTVLPPTVGAAAVWGQRGPVMGLLERVGALYGDLAVIHADGTDWPAVLGPVSMAPEPTVSRQLDGTEDRVRALIRVPREQLGELAKRLHAAAAKHAASRERGELRFAVSPKEVI
ncbi:primosome assembly protein PriA [Bifidobacterium primatium]|uniref:Primosome assembly protein PriA n=1 Tax=Bifidobacterium primatium TaxID=2045438 RepID=A0A2M9H7L6_9BIFI|nr:primosomal protein N' [Bifidobacterium primatium]PJM72785.1 primosome assembly protein PriA [Bifidobacterium primatium]